MIHAIGSQHPLFRGERGRIARGTGHRRHGRRAGDCRRGAASARSVARRTGSTRRLSPRRQRLVWLHEVTVTIGFHTFSIAMLRVLCWELVGLPERLQAAPILAPTVLDRLRREKIQSGKRAINAGSLD